LPLVERVYNEPKTPENLNIVFRQVERNIKTTKFPIAERNYEAIYACTKTFLQLFSVHLFRAVTWTRYNLFPYQYLKTKLDLFLLHSVTFISQMFASLGIYKPALSQESSSREDVPSFEQNSKLSVWDRSSLVACQSLFLTGTSYITEIFMETTTFLLGKSNYNGYELFQNHAESFVSRITYSFCLGLSTAFRAFTLPFSYSSRFYTSTIFDILFLIPTFLFSHHFSRKARESVERSLQRKKPTILTK